MSESTVILHAGRCLACPDLPELPWPEIVGHLKAKHGFSQATPSQRVSIAHVDAQDWYGDRIKWLINGAIEVYEIQRYWRHKSRMPGGHR